MHNATQIYYEIGNPIYRILDEKEEQMEEQARAVKADLTPSLAYPYRWQDWASPFMTGTDANFW